MNQQGVVFSQWQAENWGVAGWVDTKEYFTPSDADVERFLLGLRGALEQAGVEPQRFDPWAAKSEGRARFVREESAKILDRLDGYRYQVFGVIVDGERRLYVSFLPGSDWDDFGDHFSDWLERPLAVSDGGFWFWSIHFALESGVYSNLDSHGYA